MVTAGRMWQQIGLWVTQLLGANFSLLLLLLLPQALLGQVISLHKNAKLVASQWWLLCCCCAVLLLLQSLLAQQECIQKTGAVTSATMILELF